MKVYCNEYAMLDAWSEDFLSEERADNGSEYRVENPPVIDYSELLDNKYDHDLEECKAW